MSLRACLIWLKPAHPPPFPSPPPPSSIRKRTEARNLKIEQRAKAREEAKIAGQTASKAARQNKAYGDEGKEHDGEDKEKKGQEQEVGACNFGSAERELPSQSPAPQETVHLCSCDVDAVLEQAKTASTTNKVAR